MTVEDKDRVLTELEAQPFTVTELAVVRTHGVHQIVKERLQQANSIFFWKLRNGQSAFIVVKFGVHLISFVGSFLISIKLYTKKVGK